VKKSAFYHTPWHLTPPLGGFPPEYQHPVWYGKTRMVSLPDGKKISKISLFVLAQITNVTGAQTYGRTDTGSGNSIASHGKNGTRSGWVISVIFPDQDQCRGQNSKFRLTEVLSPDPQNIHTRFHQHRWQSEPYGFQHVDNIRTHGRTFDRFYKSS